MPVVVNMTKAREIQMNIIREARNAALAQLDVPYMRALETGNKNEQQRIATLKKTLRDIPQTLDLITYKTPEALASAWPEELS